MDAKRAWISPSYSSGDDTQIGNGIILNHCPNIKGNELKERELQVAEYIVLTNNSCVLAVSALKDDLQRYICKRKVESECILNPGRWRFYTSSYMCSSHSSYKSVDYVTVRSCSFLPTILPLTHPPTCICRLTTQIPHLHSLNVNAKENIVFKVYTLTCVLAKAV